MTTSSYLMLQVRPFRLCILLKYAWILFLGTFIFSADFTYAQSIGINNDNSIPHPSAILDVKSTNKGILIPRLSSVDRTGIVSPSIGLFVFDTNTLSFWYRDTSAWTNLLSMRTGWSVSGNNAVTTDFIGTTNNQSLLIKANNQQAGKIDLPL